MHKFFNNVLPCFKPKKRLMLAIPIALFLGVMFATVTYAGGVATPTSLDPSLIVIRDGSSTQWVTVSGGDPTGDLFVSTLNLRGVEITPVGNTLLRIRGIRPTSWPGITDTYSITVRRGATSPAATLTIDVRLTPQPLLPPPPFPIPPSWDWPWTHWPHWNYWPSGWWVSVSPSSATVNTGSSRTFTARHNAGSGWWHGGTWYDSWWNWSGVTWTVSGNHSSSTRITSGGTLHVASNETAGSLTVTATSQAWPHRSDSAHVTVGHPAPPRGEATFRITFAGNGGNPASASRNLVEGRSLGRDMPIPTRRDHHFMGWNTRADGTGAWVDETTRLFSAQTLFAQWEPARHYPRPAPRPTPVPAPRPTPRPAAQEHAGNVMVNGHPRDVVMNADGSYTIAGDRAQTMRLSLPVQLVSADDRNVVVIAERIGGTDVVVPMSMYLNTWVTGQVPAGGTFSAINNRRTFDDTAGHWAESSIDFVAARELMSEPEGRSFLPGNAVARADVMTAVGKMAGVDVSFFQGSRFNDVDPGWYSAPYIEWATANNIFGGVEAAIFDPHGSLSQEELALILWNLSNYMNVTIRSTGDADTFFDAGSVSWWAAEAVEALRAAGILTADEFGLFNPQSTVSRAHAATTITLFIQRTN